MNDTWEKFLQAWEPDINALRDMLRIGIEPKIKFQVYELAENSFCLSIIESWPENCYILQYSESYYEKAIKFIESELLNWPDVTKINQDTWCFTSRNQAEKFITVFNLKWEQ